MIRRRLIIEVRDATSHKTQFIKQDFTPKDDSPETVSALLLNINSAIHKAFTSTQFLINAYIIPYSLKDRYTHKKTDQKPLQWTQLKPFITKSLPKEKLIHNMRSFLSKKD